MDYAMLLTLTANCGQRRHWSVCKQTEVKFEMTREQRVKQTIDCVKWMANNGAGNTAKHKHDSNPITPPETKSRVVLDINSSLCISKYLKKENISKTV